MKSEDTKIDIKVEEDPASSSGLCICKTESSFEGTLKHEEDSKPNLLLTGVKKEENDVKPFTTDGDDRRWQMLLFCPTCGCKLEGQDSVKIEAKKEEEEPTVAIPDGRPNKRRRVLVMDYVELPEPRYQGRRRNKPRNGSTEEARHTSRAEASAVMDDVRDGLDETRRDPESVGDLPQQEVGEPGEPDAEHLEEEVRSSAMHDTEEDVPEDARQRDAQGSTVDEFQVLRVLVRKLRRLRNPRIGKSESIKLGIRSLHDHFLPIGLEAFPIQLESHVLDQLVDDEFVANLVKPRNFRPVKILCMKPFRHPYGPTSPGAPGLYFTAARTRKESESWCRRTGRVRIMMQAQDGLWQYMGQYILLPSAPLTVEEWRAGCPQWRQDWARDIWWSGSRKDRMRAYLKKIYHRAPTEMEILAKMKRTEGDYQDLVTVSDIEKALWDGDIPLAVCVMQCVGYDAQFALDNAKHYRPKLVKRLIQEPRPRGDAAWLTRAIEQKWSTFETRSSFRRI